MRPKSFTVYELATRANLDPDLALARLQQAGLNIKSTSTEIPSRHFRKIEHLLGLEKKITARRTLDISNLASRTGKEEVDIREALFRAGILKKKRLKRIPEHFLRKTEELLGLRKQDVILEEKQRSGAREAKAQIDEVSRKRKGREWAIVGKVQDLVFLTPKDVEEIHWVLVRDFAKTKDPVEPPGVKDSRLLDSAIHRPRTALGLNSKYPTIAMAGAALLHSIVHNHPFHNGNKRTAMVALLAFLDKNGWVIVSATEDDIYNLLLNLAGHNLRERDGKMAEGADAEVLYCANWLQARIRKVVFHEHPIQFRHLRTILSGCDCELEITKGSGRVNITRHGLRTQVAYRDEGREVDKSTMHKVRKDLHLDEAHGFDSDIFYNQGPRIPEFINKYRKLLTRLAKV